MWRCFSSNTNSVSQGVPPNFIQSFVSCFDNLIIHQSLSGLHYLISTPWMRRQKCFMLQMVKRLNSLRYPVSVVQNLFQYFHSLVWYTFQSAGLLLAYLTALGIATGLNPIWQQLLDEATHCFFLNPYQKWWSFVVGLRLSQNCSNTGFPAERCRICDFECKALKLNSPITTLAYTSSSVSNLRSDISLEWLCRTLK